MLRRLIPLALATLAACSHADVSVLQAMEQARGTPAYAGFCEPPVACGKGQVCARVHGHRGAACLERASAASASGSATEVRRLALLSESAYATSATLGGPQERLTAGAGQAEALELRRAFSPTADGAAINAALEADAGRLAALPDGAPLAGYVRAGVVENRVLAGQPSSDQCADLRAALAMLPASLADPRFDRRLQQRRATLSAALAQPQRRCS